MLAALYMKYILLLPYSPSYVTLKVILKLLLRFTVTPTVTLCQEHISCRFCFITQLTFIRFTETKRSMGI